MENKYATKKASSRIVTVYERVFDINLWYNISIEIIIDNCWGNNMDIENLSKIKSDREECITLIKLIPKNYKKEHYHILGQSVTNSINRYISIICYSSDYLKGLYIMCDEINPIKLTTYLSSIKNYDCDEEILLLYVAHRLKNRINEFYRDLKNGIYPVGVAYIQNNKDKSEYIKKCDYRINSGLKLIRS